MNVLMIVRSNWLDTPGGDTIQIKMTAKYLHELGVSVDICPANTKQDYNKYSLIHFFNIIRPDDILPHINHDVPFVVSTIFVDYSEYERLNRTGIAGALFRFFAPGVIEYIKAVARWAKNGDEIKSSYYLTHGHDASIRKIAARAKLLLPNSHSEYKRFRNYINLDVKYRKVVNAIDTKTFDDQAVSNELYRDHVLCVGRIEGRKNQLNLIKAMQGTGIPLTIIGKASPNHVGYYEECKALAAKTTNVSFIEHISHNDLVKIYAAAKVHVLPSWFETTGLSSLEAGAMGCNLVVTRKGDTEEYFSDMAYYCDPADIDSIRTQVVKAFQEEVNPRLKKHILENCTWQLAAEQTLEAYREVLPETSKI